MFGIRKILTIIATLSSIVYGNVNVDTLGFKFAVSGCNPVETPFVRWISLYGNAYSEPFMDFTVLQDGNNYYANYSSLGADYNITHSYIFNDYEYDSYINITSARYMNRLQLHVGDFFNDYIIHTPTREIESWITTAVLHLLFQSTYNFVYHYKIKVPCFNGLSSTGTNVIGFNKVSSTGTNVIGFNKVSSTGTNVIGFNEVSSTGTNVIGFNEVSSTGTNVIGFNKVSSTGTTTVGFNEASSAGTNVIGFNEISSTGTTVIGFNEASSGNKNTFSMFLLFLLFMAI